MDRLEQEGKLKGVHKEKSKCKRGLLRVWVYVGGLRQKTNEVARKMTGKPGRAKRSPRKEGDDSFGQKSNEIVRNSNSAMLAGAGVFKPQDSLDAIARGDADVSRSAALRAKSPKSKGGPAPLSATDAGARILALEEHIKLLEEEATRLQDDQLEIDASAEVLDEEMEQDEIPTLSGSHWWKINSLAKQVPKPSGSDPKLISIWK